MIQYTINRVGVELGQYKDYVLLYRIVLYLKKRIYKQ